MQDPNLLPIRLAATHKGVPPHQIQRGIDAGELPAVQEGGAWFVRRDDLDRWEPHPKTAGGTDYTVDEANEALRSS